MPRNVRNEIRGLNALLNRALFGGNRYRCPVCGRQLRTFFPLLRRFRVPLGIEGRTYTVSDYETLNVENYQCPACGCSDRERLYALFLTRQPLEPGKRLLHFAPEPSLTNYLWVRKRDNYTTADLEMPDADEHLDLTDLGGIEDGSVDYLLCSHVLEHVPDDRKAMRELHRVLAPSGWALLMTPILPALDTSYEDPTKTTERERLEHFGQRDHVRVYAKCDFVARLTEAGFTVDQLGADHFGPDAFERHGVGQGSVLYVAHKGRPGERRWA